MSKLAFVANFLFNLRFDSLVEPLGFEPRSRQSTYKPSTCLACS